MPSQPRWFHRVLPVSAVAVALLALAALIAPGFRDQLALSATHRPEPYAALSFARSDAGVPLVCTGERGRVRVAFAVESHLAATDLVRWIAAVSRDSGAGDAAAPATAVRRGTVAVSPGTTVEVSRTLPRPAGDHTVRVVLPDLGRQVHAHCEGSAR